MKLKEIQEEVDEWVRTNGGGYWEPLSQLARLQEEVGELAKVLNHVYGQKKKKPEEAMGSLEEEIGDVLFTLVCIANSSGIDLLSAHKKVMAKYNIRDKDRFKT